MSLTSVCRLARVRARVATRTGVRISVVCQCALLHPSIDSFINAGMPIGGIASELISPLSDNFEPHVAEDAIVALVANASAAFSAAGGKLTVVRNTGWLVDASTSTSAAPTAGAVQPTAIRSVTTLLSPSPGGGGQATTCGRVFIDCSYEGDLLQRSGAEFALGRESIDQCVDVGFICVLSLIHI